ncbi:Imm1 family immunity protein [Allokutzneria sp. A3M-2-11 16]|uniref:Imm1 family immunity protein n=1 Tax=Allokutzneria sp. A3M-2-11 16 TaxID=2962043 RepID=UPI0020B7235B|nr:Imm1 family immunity protein [Allokutzneria sp. A3M-2-11 16]MCP3797888.1 Imm1 family immunity protein [Allokutzneria sp. A3M-2-11 16]
MAALNAYYDFEHGETPARITDEDQLAEALEEVRRTRTSALVELLPADDLGAATLDVGLNDDRGVLFYSGPDHAGCGSRNPGATAVPEPVLYYYMTSDTEYPATAEIPVEDVIAAAREHLRTSGRRPTSVDWQDFD